jgi:hypothetical protein
MICAQLNEDSADSSNSVDSAPSEDNIAESTDDKLFRRKRERRCYSARDCKRGRYCSVFGYCRKYGK